MVTRIRRWKRFLREGLQRYARERDDAAIPWPRRVSRLSPYLHHGHVSPFRIAREALQAEGDGAEKFLDEVLVGGNWRATSVFTRLIRSVSRSCRIGRKRR